MGDKYFDMTELNRLQKFGGYFLITSKRKVKLSEIIFLIKDKYKIFLDGKEVVLRDINSWYPSLNREPVRNYFDYYVKSVTIERKFFKKRFIKIEIEE